MQIAKNIRFIPETGLGLVSALLIIGNVLLNTTPVLGLPKNTVVATIPTGTFLGSVVVRPDSKVVYVGNNDTNTVQVIDAATNTITFTIPVGNLPYALAVSPDGSTLYVANAEDNTVSIVSTANNQVTKTIQVGQYPLSLAVSPDGKSVYAANINSGTVSIIDTATNTVSANLSVPGNADQVVFSRSGSSAYVQSYIRLSRRKANNYLSIIDTATQTLSNSLESRRFGGTLAVSPVVNRIYLLQGTPVAVFNTTRNRVVKTFLAPLDQGTFNPAVVTPDGRYLYDAIGDGGVAMVDVIALQYVSSFSINGQYAVCLAIAPNGKYAYVCGDFPSSVVVVDITPQ